jgi:hypothetical protein
MSAHEWETAIEHFRIASGYLDSDDLLELAGKEQQRTEDLYEKGMAFATAKNWIAAMQTLGDLKKEQAGYKETNKTWDEAREQVYKQALQGTVVSRSRSNGSNLSVVPAGREAVRTARSCTIFRAKAGHPSRLSRPTRTGRQPRRSSFKAGCW